MNANSFLLNRQLMLALLYPETSLTLGLENLIKLRGIDILFYSVKHLHRRTRPKSMLANSICKGASTCLSIDSYYWDQRCAGLGQIQAAQPGPRPTEPDISGSVGLWLLCLWARSVPGFFGLRLG